MNAPAILNLIAAAGTCIALIGALRTRHRHLSTPAKLFLCLMLATCLFSSSANVLQHAGITDRLDVYEDHAEVLFVPFGLCFIYAVWTRRELDRRRGIEAKLDRERYLLHAILDHTPDAVYFKDADSRFTRISRSLAERFDLDDPRQAVGKSEGEFFEADHARQTRRDEQEVMRTGSPLVAKESKQRWANGTETWASTTTLPLLDEDGQVVGTFAIARDITEAKVIEAHLRQAQKMEAVGQLAGGIAHDFNNQLTVIRGYCDLLLIDGDVTGDLRDNLVQVRQAAERARKLTNRLLALGRKQPLSPEVLRLQDVVGRLERPLASMMPEGVRLRIKTDPRTRRVLADPDQLEQAITNLVINARDAVRDGHEVVIETANAELDERFAAAHPGTNPGAYAVLTVRDNGTGMDEPTRDRVFEPFFTTKTPGQGTGLGLPMVYGFVTQSGGHIEVDSKPARGTTVTIYLPCVVDDARGSVPTTASSGVPGDKTILVTEDDESIRRLVAHVLDSQGYTVLTADRPDEAVRLTEQHAGPIDLLVTDVLMPGMTGVDLARRLTADGAVLAVLYISGHAGQDLLSKIGEPEQVNLLAKPFSPDDLRARVGEALGEARAT